MKNKSTKEALWWMKCMIDAVCKADRKHAKIIYKLANRVAKKETRDE